MSRQSSFKFQRSIPGGRSPGSPAFSLFSLRPLRQIPTLAGSTNSGDGITPVMTAYVPASSWALNKLLLIRGIYQLTLPTGVPNNYNMNEYISITGAPATGMLIPTSIVTSAGGVYSTMRFVMAIRYDPFIYALDEADAMQHNWLNLFDSQEHAMIINPTSPPFNYGAQIEVSINAELPSGVPGANLTCLWCESFLEQATNLGQATS